MKPVKPSRQNRTITVDFNSQATYHQLCGDGPRFIDFVVAFILSIGLQLKHKCGCSKGRLTRHSHYARLRLDGLTIWRIQCTQCRAVFTVLPHFVLRYRKMKAEVAKKVLMATHGGLSLEICAVIENVDAMAIYRLVCSVGRTCLVKLLAHCHLPLPVYFIADEKHTHCLDKRVYLPTIGCGRVISIEVEKSTPDKVSPRFLMVSYYGALLLISIRNQLVEKGACLFVMREIAKFVDD